MVVPVASSARTSRIVSVDAWRFVALALMLLDHVCLWVGGLDLVRLSLGRLAMPIFFVLGGMLVRRLSWRLVGIGVLGVVLPVFVPWVDSPNVLLWYALGAVLLVVARWGELHPLWLVLPALVMHANGFDVDAGTGYQPHALWALMAVGAAAGPGVLPGLRVPGWCLWLARRPLSFYVGHLLVLQVVALVVSGRFLGGGV